MNITKRFIASVCLNDAARKNGEDLARKKCFSALLVDKDRTFIAGECLGSGKNPYFCSADFFDEASPVFRCTCPSRQIPCKHVIGLMTAYVEGQRFLPGEIPEDILSKRANKEKRAAKAKEKEKEKTDEKAEGSGGEQKAAEPKEKTAAWKKAAARKIEAQLAGIEEAGKILYGIAGAGLGAIDAKAAGSYQAIAKQLDSYFIPGIQDEIKDLLGMISGGQGGGRKEPESYVPLAGKLCQIHTLLARGKAYLEKKMEAPEKMDTESEIEELIGHAWKLEELASYGMFEDNARLVQLCFHERNEPDKKQYVDEGFFVSLGSGKVYRTRNYRPYKAAKYIKEEDSVFGALDIARLYVYPSMSLNPRVRWEAAAAMSGKTSAEDFRRIKSLAHMDYAEVAKKAKNQLKDLFLPRHPAMLVGFAGLSKITGEKYVAHDPSGKAICLKRGRYCQDGFLYLLDSLPKEDRENNAMLLLFDNDIETGELSAQPLALVTDDRIVRMLY